MVLAQLLAVEPPTAADPSDLEVLDHVVVDQEGHCVATADGEGAASVQVLARGAFIYTRTVSMPCMSDVPSRFRPSLVFAHTAEAGNATPVQPAA